MKCIFRKWTVHDRLTQYKCKGGCYDGYLCESEYDDHYVCKWYEKIYKKIKELVLIEITK